MTFSDEIFVGNASYPYFFFFYLFIVKIQCAQRNCQRLGYLIACHHIPTLGTNLCFTNLLGLEFSKTLKIPYYSPRILKKKSSVLKN